MAKSNFGDTVKVHYTGKLKDGTVFDSSRDREPLEFQLGKKQVIPGFEDAVIGMDAGESVSVNIPAENAYGARDEKLVIQVSREQVPPEIDPKVGMRLETSQPDGTRIPITVTAVTDSDITIDANHPLAGQELLFDIEIVEVTRNA